MYVLVFIIATLTPQGEITELGLWEKPGLTKSECEHLAGVQNRVVGGVIKDQTWAVCKRDDQA